MAIINKQYSTIVPLRKIQSKGLLSNNTKAANKALNLNRSIQDRVSLQALVSMSKGMLCSLSMLRTYPRRTWISRKKLHRLVLHSQKTIYAKMWEDWATSLGRMTSLLTQGLEARTIIKVLGVKWSFPSINSNSSSHRCNIKAIFKPWSHKTFKVWTRWANSNLNSFKFQGQTTIAFRSSQ